MRQRSAYRPAYTLVLLSVLVFAALGCDALVTVEQVTVPVNVTNVFTGD